MIVLDASVFVAAFDPNDANHDASRRLMSTGSPLATIDLAGYETMNVASQWRDPESAARFRQRIAAIAEHGQLVRLDDALLERAFAIAAEHGITAYDAAYVAAAERLGGTLVSCDVRDLVSRGLAVLPADASAGVD